LTPKLSSEDFSVENPTIPKRRVELLAASVKYAAQYLTQAGEDSHEPALGLGFDGADDCAKELISGPVVACGAWAAAHAVFGSLSPGAGLHGCYEMGEALEESSGAEVVDHVEEGELYGVGQGVVAGELPAEVGFEVLEDGEELGVDGLLG
jgi:hypothetical protein